MTEAHDTITLNNGLVMPALGLGVFQTPVDETADAVTTALGLGYRLIDTAASYRNEAGVGEGVRRSGVPRDDIFLETKLWVSDYGYESSIQAFEKSATKLGVDQIDLLILHQPMPQHFERTREAYRALETLLADGKVRAIGVSNFMPHHLDALMDTATVVPAANQIELHPYFSQPAVRAANTARGTLSQAWSPIGGITFYRGFGDERTNVLADSTVSALAAAHEKSPAQILLRWQLQHGHSAIPKSTNPHRIAENFDVFDFELTQVQMAQIDALDQGRRHGPDPDEIDPLEWGIEIPQP